ncbi:hypothetical protein QBC37DRAFT_465602 [Rhypophila decipiens]|uniref:Uncharacterized protein n=1 Tax=Rhypophila decipiens TaxID=261697 RepID=A0AAN6Y9I6_9PEZI|nr:hypothetical protein QBC37DRAFT_465602 [Rhypophila decipiens]
MVEYLDLTKHKANDQTWRNRPPGLRMNRRDCHAWLAYKCGHGDFLEYHTRFGHDVSDRKGCVCGREKDRLEIETCRLFKNYARNMKPREFVERLEQQRWRALIVRTVASAFDWKVTFKWGSLPEIDTQENDSNL